MPTNFLFVNFLGHSKNEMIMQTVLIACVNTIPVDLIGFNYSLTSVVTVTYLTNTSTVNNFKHTLQYYHLEAQQK